MGTQNIKIEIELDENQTLNSKQNSDGYKGYTEGESALIDALYDKYKKSVPMTYLVFLVTGVLGGHKLYLKNTKGFLTYIVMFAILAFASNSAGNKEPGIIPIITSLAYCCYLIYDLCFLYFQIRNYNKQQLSSIKKHLKSYLAQNQASSLL